jgi:hypothetical protein
MQGLLARVVGPRFELVLENGEDAWYITADLPRPTGKPVRVEGPYRLDYAMLRLAALEPRDVAESLLAVARKAQDTGATKPVHRVPER